MENKKKFLVIGNKNAITYKETFKLIKDKKLWLGLTIPNKFVLPNGTVTDSVTGLCRWFTNLEIKKKPDVPILVKRYNPKDYPQYDNYAAINVNKVKDIPYNYQGVMGVPITILGLQYSDGYIHLLDELSNEMRYEILGITENADYLKPLYISGNEKYNRGHINGKELYARLLIKKITQDFSTKFC